MLKQMLEETLEEEKLKLFPWYLLTKLNAIATLLESTQD
jgi:hypothetical protein